jgi:hypothetical protein
MKEMSQTMQILLLPIYRKLQRKEMHISVKRYDIQPELNLSDEDASLKLRKC